MSCVSLWTSSNVLSSFPPSLRSWISSHLITFSKFYKIEIVEISQHSSKIYESSIAISYILQKRFLKTGNSIYLLCKNCIYKPTSNRLSWRYFKIAEGASNSIFCSLCQGFNLPFLNVLLGSKRGEKVQEGFWTAPLSSSYSCWLIGILCRTVWKCGREQTWVTTQKTFLGPIFELFLEAHCWSNTLKFCGRSRKGNLLS